DDKAKRKAEVRARLEQEAKAKKKKGFMTPARKKKLRNLLRKKAAEELKKEQERRAAERRRIIMERTGQPKPLDDANEAQLQRICKEYYERLRKLHDAKFDIEYEVSVKDLEVRELAAKVNDVKGRLMEKIRMFTAKVSQMDYRAGLKTVKKFVMEEEKKEDKPEWAAGMKEKTPGAESQ
ncbi:troponin I protein-like protein, partial [Dinothrombium tinctorium]